MTSQEEADELLRKRQERRRRRIAPERRLDPPPCSLMHQQKTPFPRYVTRVRLEYSADVYFFQAFPGEPRVPLRGKPGTPAFRAAYNAALVDAIAAEDDRDDWTELQRYHEAHRRKQAGSVSEMKKSHRLPKDWTPEKGNLRRNKASAEHEPITIERLERALALCAYLVVLHGPKVAPLFEKLERELKAKRAEQNTVERAKKLLESYSVRPPCLSLAPPHSSADSIAAAAN
jgi:hypothetical protein